MPKITFLSDLDTPHRYKGKNSNHKLVIFIVVVGLIMGIIGGAGTLVILSYSPTLKSKLGIDLQTLNINKTNTEKLVLEESSAVIDSSKKVSPSVVSITSTTSVMDFFGQVSQQQAAGTGFIFTNDGYILTNKHVGSDLNGSYSVFMADGKKYEAKVVAQDPSNDLAIMKIDAKGLPVVDLGDSDKLQIGQWVIAIGNALGQLQNTVTVGVISARERALTAGGGQGGQTEQLEHLLQTDAAINSGNSGGPLVNLAGQVIGVNTAVASGAQSIGFAIPINTVKSAINSFQKNGKIVRPQLGVSYVMVTPEIATSQKLSIDHGALVSGGVMSGSAADKAGLKNGDVIIAINGSRIDQNSPLSSKIQTFQPGDEIEITYNRNGKEFKTKTKLGTAN